MLDNILPVIDAVQPEQLNITLTNLADALEGRGDELGQNLVNLDDYLRQFNKHLPSFTTDISELASVADSYSKAAPDLLRFLENSAFSSRTVTAKQDTLLPVPARYGNLLPTPPPASSPRTRRG